MLSFQENQLKKADPNTIQLNKTQITVQTQYGQKITPIIRLPKASLGQMMSTYQYQFEVQQQNKQEIEFLLYILNSHNLSLFKNKISLQQKSESRMEESFQNYSMNSSNNNGIATNDLSNFKKWSSKNSDKNSFEISGIKCTGNVIEEVYDAKYPRQRTMKVNVQINQTECGLCLCYLINQQEKEVKVGINLNIEQEVQNYNNNSDSMIEVEVSNQVEQQQQKSNVIVCSFPQMSSSSNKKERQIEQQNLGFQNNSFFDNNDTILSREIKEKFMELQILPPNKENQQYQQQQPHNLRKRKLTNYSTLGQEVEDDDSTCENSSEVSTPTHPKQKKQRSRKSSFNVYHNSHSIIIPNKTTPLKDFPKLSTNHGMVDEDESYSACSSTNASHKNYSNKKKGDKKNVVKNFTKAFSKFIMNEEYDKDIKGVLPLEQDSIDNFRNLWTSFFNKPKFNNKLIKELILNKQFHDVFHLFLSKYAYDWLMNHSSVEDKESHIEVLKDYIKASEKPDEIENIVILKCRN